MLPILMTIAVLAAALASVRRPSTHCGTGLVAAVALVASLVVVPAAVPSIALADSGTSVFVPVGPARLADTRDRYRAGFTKSGATTITVPVAGVVGVPSGAVAAALTISVTGAKSPGFVTVWPAGEEMPLSANVTFDAGETISNALLAKLGGGAVNVYTSAKADVIVDIAGAFLPSSGDRAGRLVAVEPRRVLDTRTGAAMPPGSIAQVALPGAVPADALAVAVTLTTAQQNSPGYFTAFASGMRVPLAASLTVDTPNSVRGATVVVPVSASGLSVFSSSGGHLVVDFVGWFTGPSADWGTGGLFVPQSPRRLLDTRSTGRVGTGGTIAVGTPAGVAVGNLTLTDATAAGYVVAYETGALRPATASLNASRAGQTVSNLTFARSSDAGMSIFVQNGGQIVFDETGSFTADAPTLAVGTAVTAPARALAGDPTTSVAATTAAPTTLAPATTVAPTCTVSSILVPSCGAWLGSSTPSKDGTYDYAEGLAEYEAAAGVSPDIIHFYKSGAVTFPTAAEKALAERAGKQRSLLLYNWKPSGTLTWRQIADGGADANITTVANGLKNHPRKLFLAIYHEPEDNVVDTPGSGMTPEDYADMFRHVVTELRAAGVTNAVYVMNYMGFTRWASIVDRLYPGDDVVDWIGYDPYAHAGETTFAKLLNRPSGSWPGFYSWATTKSPTKPIMLSEWGYDLDGQPNAPAIIANGPATLQSHFPRIKALVYWNSVGSDHSYRLDRPTTVGAAFGAAFATFAADEYFSRTPTFAAP